MAKLVNVRVLLFIVAASTGVLGGLRSWIQMKSQMKNGDPLSIKCNVQLEDKQEIHKIAITQDFREFYRYEPKSDPQITVGFGSGIKINNEKSTTDTVYLDSVDLKGAGEYRCEVVVTGPYDYQTTKTKLTVVVPPTTDPVITGAESKYKVGDTVKVTCTSGPSYPAANVQWHLNDMTWPSNREYTEEGGLYTMAHTLELKLQDYHFRGGHINLRCDVNIGFIYKKSVSVSAAKDA